MGNLFLELIISILNFVSLHIWDLEQNPVLVSSYPVIYRYNTGLLNFDSGRFLLDMSRYENLL